MEDKIKKLEDIEWINTAKFLCMLLIYYFHTSNRLGVKLGFEPYFYPFFVNAFFFLTGYLLFKKQFEQQYDNLSNQKWRTSIGKKMLRNIIFKLLIPSILFSAILYIPKIFIRKVQNDVFVNFVDSVILGGTYWFTSALIIAELCLFVVVNVYRSRKFTIYILLSLALFALAHLCSDHSLCVRHNKEIPWAYMGGLMSIIFIVAGGVYYKYETMISNFFSWKKTNVYVLLICCILTVYFLYPKYCWPHISSGEANYSGIITSILYIVCFTQFCKILPSNRISAFCGRNTLVLYFLSGGFPEIISILFGKVLPGYTVSLLFVSAIVAFVLAFSVALFITKRLPFVTDLRGIKCK